MRVLAIETASEACSIALFDGEAIVAHDHRLIGRGHAEALVPMIAALPDKGRANRILVSLGPGSFTGVRIGLAAARALGFAWGGEVLAYPTLALAAAQAQHIQPAQPVTICMNGGHGEWFVADFGADGLPQGQAASLTPDEARARKSHPLVAGNRAAALAALRADQAITAIDLLPDATSVRFLNPRLLTHNLAPIYGRGPDATPLAQQGRP
ncbi:MAG: tRNA (adenosine(37)-N6)-threonylcarbamoyltransferase complex dimerization subunit type 1 TsaB [Alphaproteobacteria bacterium HGW-Alphaproteobacteria-14]|nr:MAG: tRNA (adenosine(37)-N6)-threonylcarbamoyltransferase complex dimerization subunit type 1 TsaB [Alphaproteobacteria bacterium HGW-Alphaproteobacteria-14]